MLVALGVGLRVGEAVLEVSRSLQVAFGRFRALFCRSS